MAWTPLVLAWRLLASISRLTGGGESGFSGVALSVAGSALVLSSTMVMNADVAAQQLQSIFNSSLSRVSGTLEVRGSVVMTAAGTPLTLETIELTLSAFGEGTRVNMDPQAPDGLLIAYADDATHSASVPYDVRFLRSNNDAYLDAGELAVISVRLRSLPGASPHLSPGERWTLSLTSQTGVTLEVSRRMPAGMSPVMLLP